MEIIAYWVRFPVFAMLNVTVVGQKLHFSFNTEHKVTHLNKGAFRVIFSINEST